MVIAYETLFSNHYCVMNNLLCMTTLGSVKPI